MPFRRAWQRYPGPILFFGCAAVWGIVNYTGLHRFFDVHLAGQGYYKYLRSGDIHDPGYRFADDVITPVRRVTVVLACGAILLGWYWLLASLRKKIVWRQIAGLFSAFSLSIVAVVESALLFATIGSHFFESQPGHFVQSCLSHQDIFKAIALTCTFFGEGNWRIAFVVALGLMTLLW
jgi:hypothetical protein